MRRGGGSEESVITATRREIDPQTIPHREKSKRSGNDKGAKMPDPEGKQPNLTKTGDLAKRDRLIVTLKNRGLGRERKGAATLT